MTNQIAALSQGPPRHWYPYPWQTEQPSHGNNRGWYATIEAIEETIEAIEATIEVGEATEATTEAPTPMKI